MTNAIYEESKTRQSSQKELILKSFKLAGSNGILNTELNDIMLRYGQIIYLLRLDGYEIKTDNVGKGIVKYTLLNPEPKAKPIKKSGIDIIREELDDVFSLMELENILERNNLQVIHRPNGLNKALV